MSKAVPLLLPGPSGCVIGRPLSLLTVRTKSFDLQKVIISIATVLYVGFLTTSVWARIAHSVLRLAMRWMFRGSNPGGGEIFRTSPDRPWDPPRALYTYNGYRVFPGGKAAGAWRRTPTPSS
jgi:hypothetical protein